MNILLGSSLLFSTNAITALYAKQYVYSMLFVGLTITSLLFHYNTNVCTSILDKTLILMVVLYGGYILYVKSSNECKIKVGFIILSFLATIILFYYGYCKNQFCYHPDKHIGDRYHCLLHLISSIGHHCITFL